MPQHDQDMRCLNLLSAAEHVYEKCGDRPWSRRLIDRAMKFSPDWTGYWLAGEQMSSIHKNKKLARDFFQKALESSDNCMDMGLVAGSIISELKDRKWAEKIIKEAVARIEDANDQLFLIHGIIDPDELNNRNWALELLCSLKQYKLDEIEEIIYQTILDDNNISEAELLETTKEDV